MLRKSQIDSIVELGRQRKSINTDQLQEMLPVNDLALDELIDIVEALEGAGVTVRVDPSLLIRSGQPAEPRAEESFNPLAERKPLRPPDAASIRATSHGIEKGRSTRTVGSHSYRVPFSVHIIVGAALVLAAIVAGLLFLAWS